MSRRWRSSSAGPSFHRATRWAALPPSLARTVSAVPATTLNTSTMPTDPTSAANRLALFIIIPPSRFAVVSIC